MASLTLRGRLGPARAALTGRFMGKFYLDNTEDNRRDPAARQEPGYVPRINDAFAVVDLAAWLQVSERVSRAVGLSRAELELRVNNLLDKKYTAFGYMDTEPMFIPAATRGAYIGLAVGL
jgi:outer membrane receptor protein involved in Fe transport